MRQLFLCIFLVQSTFNLYQCFSMQNSFRYCEGLSNAKHLDLETNCKKENSEMQPSSGLIQNYTKAFNVDYENYKMNSGLKFGLTFLTKISNQVNGIGHQCKMEKIIITTFQNIFGSNFKDQTTEIVVLSPKACWDMVNTGFCKDKTMTCDGKSCKYSAKFQLSYAWLESRKHEEYNCETHERILTAKNENDLLFGNADGLNSCKTTDFFCYKLDYIVVWNKDIVHKCPYEIITVNSSSLKVFDPEDDFMFAENIGKTNNIGIISPEENLYFSLTTVEYVCNSLVVGTNEGIYLTSPTFVKNFRHHAINLKDVSDIALADKDFTVFQDTIDKQKLYDSICFLFMNTIKVFSMQQNQYISLLDRKGKNIVLYSTNENIYVPNCFETGQISVHETTENCYEDVPISFTNQNRSINGFLQNDRIIKRNSIQISCDTLSNNFVSVDKNSRIRRNGQNNYLETVHENTIQKIDFFDLNLMDPNFHHNHVLIESIDVLDEIHRYSQVSDSSLGEFVVSVSGHGFSNSINSMKKPLATIGTASQDVINKSFQTYYSIKLLVISLVCFVIFILIVFIITKICKIFNIIKNRSKFTSNKVTYIAKDQRAKILDV